MEKSCMTESCAIHDDDDDGGTRYIGADVGGGRSCLVTFRLPLSLAFSQYKSLQAQKSISCCDRCEDTQAHGRRCDRMPYHEGQRTFKWVAADDIPSSADDRR